MTPGVHSRRRATPHRVWFGSVLMLIGAMLTGMGLISFGAIGAQSPQSDTAPVPEPEVVHEEVERVLHPHAPSAHDVREQGQVPAPPPATAMRPAARPAAGELSAGSVAVAIRHWWADGALLEGAPSEYAPLLDHQPEQAATPEPAMPEATHVAIPAVGVDTEIVEVSATQTVVGGQAAFTWQVADWAAGHHDTSANPGERGNIVLSGHDDVRGEVFRGLHRVKIGDEVVLTTAAGAFTYTVAEIHFREYRKAPIEDLIAAGQFLAPMPEERLTLVTCWPYKVDTHRMIVVAIPVHGR